MGLNLEALAKLASQNLDPGHLEFWDPRRDSDLTKLLMPYIIGWEAFRAPFKESLVGKSLFLANELASATKSAVRGSIIGGAIGGLVATAFTEPILPYAREGAAYGIFLDYGQYAIRNSWRFISTLT